MILKPLYDNIRSIYTEENFSARILSEKDFIDIDVSDTVKKRAIEGSIFFKQRIDNQTLFPDMSYISKSIDTNEDLLIHNYTGACPVQTFEINPVKGCNVGCVYCLVDDGIHNDLVVYENYHKLVEKRLEEQRHEEHYYYFSPKTEALCEATLQTGVAHNILLTFIEHFEKYPDSKARLFIASKAGVEALQYVHNDNSILDLLIKLKDKMQFNISLSIFPSDARNYIEPYASSLQSRLAAATLCQENGIMANSALVQPILINVLTDEVLDEFFKSLKNHGIVNIKPEFLTANIENMVLMAQILEMYNKNVLKEIFELYFKEENINHIKQRGRTAPKRNLSEFWIHKMKAIAKDYGISTSICYWVRSQLNIGEEDIPIVNENGFKCLGYQTKLF